VLSLVKFMQGGEGMAGKTIRLEIDLTSTLNGFRSAHRPTEAHRRILAHYASPLLLGPEPSDNLLEMVMHMFSEEEAEIVRYLPPLRPRTIEKVASLSGRPENEVRNILDFLAFTKRVVLGWGEPRKYTLLPIVPGTFEMALMTPDLSSRNLWHKRFAELFEKIWNEGYMANYVRRVRSNVHYLPVKGSVDPLYRAWPSDRLEEVLDPYDDFAVGMCQCRMTMELVGKGCGKPLEACVTMGPTAIRFIDRGLMRKSDKKEILEIKGHAEEEGCVSWMMEDIGGVHRGNSSCSCCSCCCHFLQSLSRFNAPGFISNPHFLPSRDEAACVNCGKCASACPMDAWNFRDGKLSLDSMRCIGCGLCVTACPVNALSLKESRNSIPKQPGWFRYYMDLAPGYLFNAFRVWLRRAIS